MSVSTPNFLIDSYQTYKAETKEVTAWLNKSARQIRNGVLPGSSSTRRRPKKANKHEVTLTEEEETLKLSEYVSLARVISQADTPVEVPKNVLQNLRSIIGKRKKFSNWFSKQVGDGAHESSNDRHRHAISIFEQVLKFLSGKAASLPADADSNGEKKSASQHLNEGLNSFAALDVEDSPSDDEDPKAPKYDEQILREELYFKFYCFYHDLNRFRDYICVLWESYRIGKIDLRTAAVVTDVAFDILQKAQERFHIPVRMVDKNHRVMNIYQQTALFMYEEFCKIAGQDPEYREDAGDWVNMAMYNSCEWLCLPTRNIMVSVMNSMGSESSNSVALPAYGKHSKRTKPRGEMLPRERLDEDCEIVCDLLTAMEAIRLGDKYVTGDRTNQLNPIQDKLSKGLWDCLSQRSQPDLWLVFATQIYLDIYYVLGRDAGRAFTDLRGAASTCMGTVKKVFAEAEHSGECKGWVYPANQPLADIVNSMDIWVKKDYFSWLWAKLGQPGPIPPRHLFSNHPILCGVILFSIDVTMQDIGLQMSSAWAAIASMAHLYNASKQSGMDVSWEDMEAFISLYGSETLFVGQPPTTAVEIFQRSATLFPKTFGVTGPKPLDVRTLGIISSIFLARYKFKSIGSRVELTIDDVERMLKSQSAATQARSGRKSKAQARMAKRFKSSRKLAPIELLDTLRISLSHEAQFLSFDYFSMHIRCMNILRELERKVSKDIPDISKGLIPRGVKSMPGNFLPTLPIWIFRQTMHIEKIPRQVRPEDTAFIKAREVLEAFIKKEGRAETWKMHAVAMEALGLECGSAENPIPGDSRETSELLTGSTEMEIIFEKIQDDLQPRDETTEGLTLLTELEKPKKPKRRPKKKKSTDVQENGEGEGEGEGDGDKESDK